MKSHAYVLQETDLEVGDVLLCYSSLVQSNFGEIEEVTGSAYSHAGISVGENMIAEAADGGVRISAVAELLEEYDHIAVFRNPFVWSPDRQTAVIKFINDAVASSAGFNRFGMWRYEVRRGEYTETMTARLEDFFAGKLAPISTRRSIYFCSEFIAAAFIDVGIIHQSAGVVLTPEIMAPADLALDPVYGWFQGYVVRDVNYEIPEDDDFFNETPIELV